MGGGDPEHVGVEEKEEDQADGHEIHIDAEDHAGVVEVPAALNAADSFGGSYEREKRGEEQED